MPSNWRMVKYTTVQRENTTLKNSKTNKNVKLSFEMEDNTFCISTSKGSACCSLSLPVLSVVSIPDFGPFNTCVVVSHFVLNLHLPDDI